MKYRKLEGIDRQLSVLVYGTPWTATRSDERENAFKSYDYAWDAGFRAFDTAHSYGVGEETFGLWLKSRGCRNEAVIIDKGCNPGQNGSPDGFSAATIREQLEESLRRLQTDHVEFYLLHRDDPRKPVFLLPAGCAALIPRTVFADQFDLFLFGVQVRVFGNGPVDPDHRIDRRAVVNADGGS